MEIHNGENYVEVKDHRCIIHPTENKFFENEKQHNLSELNIKYKMKQR